MSEKSQKILAEKIGSIEDQMLLKLKEARATFAQSEDKGTSTEDAFGSSSANSYLVVRESDMERSWICKDNDRPKQT